MPKAHHVVPNLLTGGWDVKGEDDSEPVRHFEHKRYAVEFARRLSESAQAPVVIHGKGDSSDASPPGVDQTIAR